jgi:hypothetical protein
MATHLLTLHISFGGKGNIGVTAQDFRAVTLLPFLFDTEVSFYSNFDIVLDLALRVCFLSSESRRESR